MISINPAFELLREFKECSEETEKLVLSIIRKRGYELTNNNLKSIFENGISGQYGKVYSLDPQTLISWIDKFMNDKNSNKNYLEAPLLPISTNENEIINWEKEANKCYQAFLNGVSEEYFHHAVYDNMMLDNKIELGACYKHFKGKIESNMEGEREGFLTDETIQQINAAKRKVLRDTFLDYKSRGFTHVYFVK